MKRTFILLIGVLFTVISFSQNYFRSGIFLHHSTGQYTWGPNPDGNSTTSIPQQMTLYNTLHSYTGIESITMNEEWWSPGDNEWSTQHEFFEGNTAFTDINDYLSNNKIIVIKSCYPSSSLEALGVPSDTLNPTYKCIYNYKWHWRHIVKIMKNHPDNFFVLWTNAPLEQSSTTATEATRSQSFSKWAKDTLAQGLDAAFGAFPSNIYVFDFFSKLTGANGIMLSQYRTAQYDSHPNGSATDLVAPQFVQEIFNAAIAYESIYTNDLKNEINETTINLYPNPATDIIKITGPCNEQIDIINVQGQIIKTYLPNTRIIDISKLANGFYTLRILTDKGVVVKKLIIQ